MSRIKDSKTLAAAGADNEDGRRPTIVSAPAAASPEPLDRPRRRTFTAQDKLRILGEADRAAGVPGGVGAIVRREGLYSSALSHLRRQRAAGAFEALSSAKRGLKTTEPNPLAAGQPPAEAAIGARRSDHRNPKKVTVLLGLLASASLDGRGGGLGARQRLDRRHLHSAGAVARQPSSSPSFPKTAV
jgi:transposase